MKFTSTYKLALLAALLAGCGGGGGGSGGADIKAANEPPPDPALAYVGTWETGCRNGVHTATVTITPGSSPGTLIQSRIWDSFELGTDCRGQRTTRVIFNAPDTIMLFGSTTANVESWDYNGPTIQVKFEKTMVFYEAYKVVMEGLGVERVPRSGGDELCNTGPGRIALSASICVPEQVQKGFQDNTGMYISNGNLHFVRQWDGEPNYRTELVLQRKR